MKMHVIIICICWLLIYELALGVGGAIEGTVYNSKTSEVIPWASVIIEGTNIGAGTDKDGNFIIKDAPLGKHDIVVSQIGYKAVHKSVEVEYGRTAKVEIGLTETPLELEGVVVTGTRTPRYIKQVPVYTEVITKRDIDDKGADNIYEALDGTAGIRVEQQCQNCNFSVLRMQGLGADHTQILMDGQPVYSGLAAVYGLQQIGTADVSQIEVVKGAGSALYGSNAIAGAINVITERPYSTKGTIGVEIGEHGTNRYKAAAGNRKDNIGVFFFAQQNVGDAIDETRDGYGADEVKHTDGLTDRVKTNNKTAGFNLFIEDITHSDELALRGRILNELRQGGELADNSYENPFSAGSERIITDRYSMAIDYWKMFPAGNEVNLELSYVRHKRNATNDTFLGDYLEANEEPPPVDVLRPYLADEDLYVANIHYIQPVGNSHRFLTGAQFSHNKLGESGKYVDFDSGEAYTSFSDKTANEVGLYVQDEFNVSSNIELTAGLRYDYHRSEDDFHGSGNVYPEGVEPTKYDNSTLNPRFAIKLSANEDLTLRGSIGTGYRVPHGFSEDLHLCSGSPRVYRGSDLVPERSISYSLTMDYTKSSFGLTLNLYRTELRDAIDFTEAEDGSRIKNLGYDYQWKNIDDAAVMGVEFSSQFAVTSSLALAVNAAHNHAEYERVRDDWVGSPYEEVSKKISRYPAFEGGFKISYKPKTWKFVFRGDYKGHMYIDYYSEDNPDNSKIKWTEAFMIFNAKVSRNLTDNLEVYVRAENLSDYVQKEKHTDDAAFMYAPVYGRLVYGGIEFSFK